MSDELQLNLSPNTFWFAPRCCVVVRGNDRDVVVGGVLLATVGIKDTALRNLLLVGVSQEPEVHLGALARAFGMSSEAVRLLRRLYETEGLEPLLERRHGGSEATKRAAVEKRARRLFEAGHTVDQVHAALKQRVGRATVGRIGQAWRHEKAVAVSSVAAPPRAHEVRPETSQPSAESEEVDLPAGLERLPTKPPQSAQRVQHLGTWLLIAMVSSLQLHARAFAINGERVSITALRLAFDAVIAALALGQQCVEGVRRLSTSSAGALLLAAAAPSPTFVRRTLGRFASDSGGAALQLAMTRGYLERVRAEAESEGPVFYIDNQYAGTSVMRRVRVTASE